MSEPNDNDKQDKCQRSGCVNMGTAPHSCPFAEDIHGDADTKCNCCDSCTQECAMDI